MTSDLTRKNQHHEPTPKIVMIYRPLSLLLVAGCASWPGLLSAQQTIQTPDGKTITVPAGVDPSQVINGMPSGGRPSRSRPPKAEGDQQQPDDKEKGKPGESPDSDGKGGEKKESLENVKRGAEPPQAPDPDELLVEPDEEGLLYFQFRNQPWPEVLRWYASVCNLSFDWQELPGDYINLATQRPHSLEETGDMINRALLMRGFTMLEDDETLTVAKVEGLNPALVPRVDPSSLAELPPHSYVRTSFALVWLLAEEVHTEFASMISKNGKLTPLQSTNRLEGMDAAANLLDIHRILEQEQSAIAMENLAREFMLEHARAVAVKEQLEAFLGIRNAGAGGGGSMSSSAARMMQQQMQQQMQQMQQQMQQAARNAQGGAATASRKRPDEVYLVANERSNSIIVHAPPNKMAIIESFIRRVDVRNESSADYQRISTRMKVFRLASLSPAELVESLTAMDVLEPTTRLQVDENNNAIIAYASVADQYMIQSVIERLDGSERRFEVVQLRRLDAESVAGSIKFLMGADEEKEDDSRRNRYIYGFGYPYGSSNNTRKSTDKMRVGSNARDNQLLLWVNDIEMEEVENLLVKLGELPRAGDQPSTLRMIDASRQPETFQYLQRLKEQWEKVSPNPLILPDAQEFAPAEDQEETTDAVSESSEASGADNADADESEQPAAADNASEITLLPPGSADDANTTWLVASLQESAADPSAPAAVSGSTADDSATPLATQASAAPAQETQAAPVKIFLDEGGNLVIQSDDTEALDRLERIMQANKPPKKPYDIFKVKYARASWVALNLEEYFDKNEEERPSFFFFFDEMNNDDEERQLGDRPPLRFIYDNDTNSIVVQGADDVDRQTIRELIDLWDVPEPVDESSIRYTKLIRIKYSRASNIVNTIKEAYRDLLSANDKAFQEQGGEDENKRDGGGGGSRQGGGFSFSGLKGKLSLGPDELTNSILISCEGQELMELVEEVIRELDEAAKNEGAVEVYRMTGGINGRSLEKSLRAFLNQSKDPKQQQPNQPQNGQPPGQEAGQQPPQATFSPGGERAPAASRRGGRR